MQFALVFVADDEPVIASTVASILQLNGYSARFFTSPIAAREAARLDAPHLLISDMTMPGLSGVDLAIQMREEYPECKILLFSGDPHSVDSLDAHVN